MLSFLFVAALGTSVQARSGEFGLLREAPRRNAADADVFRGLLELERSLQVDFSLSMSMVYTKGPTLDPTSTAVNGPPTMPPTPAATPLFPPSAILTITPSLMPVMPTPSPITLSSGPATGPAGSSTPTRSPLMSGSSRSNGTTVFECGIHGDIVLASVPSVTTTLDLTFTYWAQINSTMLDKALLDALEMMFLKSAVGATLGCNVTTKRRQLTEYHHVDSSTDFLGSCDSKIDGTTCFWLETDLVVTVNEEINALIGEFTAYAAIQDGMQSDRYVKEIDTLKKLMYLTPTLSNGTVDPLSSRDAVMDESGSNKKLRRWLLGIGLVLLVAAIAFLLYIITKKRGESKKELKESEPDVVNDGSEVFADINLDADIHLDVPVGDAQSP